MTETTPEITVSAQGLSRRFGAHTVVDDISLELKRGEILGFLGPNGAGKTTTMQMLTGNLAPSAGSIKICGVDMLDQPTAAKAHIGYLPETPPLYRELTVREYVDLAARLHRVAKNARTSAVDEALAHCNLSEVGIAQAIVHKPNLVILDEPTVGLDPNQIREIRSLIRELGRDRSVILSTHILPEVESVCDRVVILHHGKTVFGDTIDGLKKFHGGRIVHIGLRRPPALEVLAAITGVAGVEADGECSFRISFADQCDPTDALVRRAVEESWGLFQLVPAQTSVEEVFVQLTQKDEAAA